MLWLRNPLTGRDHSPQSVRTEKSATKPSDSLVLQLRKRHIAKTWGSHRRVRSGPVTGQVKSIKIDKCGLQPGTCEGSIVLAPKGGREVPLVIGPGTWIQRGDQLVLIDELAVGNYLKARAAQLPGWKDELAVTLEQTKGE